MVGGGRFQSEAGRNPRSSFEALRASQIASRGQTLRGHDVFVGARPMNAKLRKIAAVDKGQKGDAEGPILVAKRKFADLRVSVRC